MYIEKLAVLLHVLHLNSHLTHVLPLLRVDVLRQPRLFSQFLDDCLQLPYLQIH